MVVKIIDNRDYLISEIDSKTSLKIKELEKSYNEELSTLESSIKEKAKEEISKLKESHKKSIDRIKKQEESSFALYKEKSMIRTQAEVYGKVMAKVEDLILTKEKDKFFAKLAKDVEQSSDKKIKHYVVPKGVTIKGKKCIEGFDDIGVLGVVDDREEVEITLKNLLEKKSVEVNKMMEELF